MLRLVKCLSLMTCLLVFVGCASKPVLVDISNINESENLQVADLRPKHEKENEVFSIMITSDAYATYRRGDKILSPTAMRIFQHRVHEKFQSAVSAPEVKVHHLVVYMNLQSELRRSSVGAGLGGLIGVAIAANTQKHGVNGILEMVNREEFEASIKEEYTRSLYTEKQNPDRASIMAVYLDAEIDGKRSFVKSMTPTRLSDNRNPHLAAVETAVEFFLQDYKVEVDSVKLSKIKAAGE